MKDDGYFSIEGGLPPCIPDGRYEAVFEKYTKARPYGDRKPKIAIWFEITSSEDAIGVVLPKYYNVELVEDSERRKNDFKGGGHCSQFVRDYLRLFGKPARLNRIPMNVFRNKVFSIFVRTVKTDSRKQELPEAAYYSVVDQIIQIEEQRKSLTAKPLP